MPPEILVDKISAFCSIGPRPHIITGFLRQWLIDHFSSQSNIEHPELRSLLWSNVDSSKLEIESITRWKPSTTEKRPAIVIKRNDWKIVRYGIDDRLMPSEFGPDGGDSFLTFIEGSHTLFCISGSPTEAEILGAEVYREMMQFGPIVRQELDLKRFVVSGVGSLFELEEAKENYAVPVVVAYGLEESWRVFPHAPILKKIVLSRYLP